MPVCRAGTIVWASGLAAAWAATTAWAGHSSIAFALYSPLAAFGALQVSPWYGAALCIGSLVALCAAPPAERTGAVLTALALVAVSGAAIHAAYRQRTEREDFSRIVSVAAEGLSKAYMDKGPVDVRRNPLDRKVLAGQIVQVRDVTTDPLFLYRDQAREEGIVSLLCVPLRQKDQIVGVLRVYSAYPQRFGPREIRIVTAMAAQAVVALRHAELHQTALAFMRKVAHELRAPLAAVSTNLKVLLEGGLTASEEQRLRMLQRADQRIVLLLETVNDLLSLSRARLQKPSEDATSLRLQQVVGSVVALMRPQAEAAGVAVSVDAAEDAPPVVGNPYEIEELIGNLVSNAMKYTPRGGQITAAVEQRDDEVVVRVADTGIGIPADEMPRLFQEFHRCANARRSDIVGTGLGMVIVKTIADRHHAVLRVESEEGKGTTVEVAFPLGEPA